MAPKYNNEYNNIFLYVSGTERDKNLSSTSE